VNASVEFDLKTLAPTYHLVVGLPGRSNALAIATRLGLPKDVVESARGTIDPSELRAEDLLDEIHRERERTRQARTRAEEAQHSAQVMKAELAERLEKIEDERVDLLEKARKQSQREIDELREEAGKLRAQMARARQPLETVREVQEAAEELEERVAPPVRRQAVPESAPDRPLRLGDTVRVRSLGRGGIVTALGESEAEVQIGSLRARAKLGELELMADAAPETKDDDWGGIVLLPDSPGSEISLRGQRYEDAFAKLDKYLDQAYASGLHSARIIHGKGTGILRDMVRKELDRRNYVTRYDYAQPHEGGEGVTVAYFKDS
jgi:DNA mismatch repair protein MutS2